MVKLALTDVQEDLFTLFDSINISVTTHTHRPVFTVDEGLDIEEEIPGSHCKSLFLKTKKGHYFLVVMLGHQRLDLKGLQNELKSANLSFASPERLQEKLGIEPGSVTPFAVVNDKAEDVQVILDEEMMQADYLNYHPLRNDMTCTIARNDLVKFLEHTKHDPMILRLPKL